MNRGDKMKEIIENKIKELEETQNVWLLELDRNAGSILANERLNMIYYEILILKEVLEESQNIE